MNHLTEELLLKALENTRLFSSAYTCWHNLLI